VRGFMGCHLWLLVLGGCAASTPPDPDLARPGSSFPEMFARESLAVGAPGQVYVLDGVLLRAMSVAADDFLPHEQEGQACWSRRTAYRFRLLREADIVFVRMDVDPRACGTGGLPLDGGVTYSVRVSDGVILRRLHDGEPNGSPAPAAFDAGIPDASPETSSMPVGDTTWGTPDPSFPAQWLDAGRPVPPLAP
jgi:hypothetical protein